MNSSDPFAKYRRKEPVTEKEMPKASSPEDLFAKYRRKPQKTNWESLLDEMIPDFSDIASQTAKGAAKGFLGAYGNILDLAGLQRKGEAPGQEALTRLEPGLSDVQLAAISDSEDILPRYTSLPSSEEVGQGIKALGGPGEAKTRLGRYGERIGEFAGGGAAIASPQAKLATAAGTVGQSLEELGAPKWLQAVGEIATFLRGSRAKTPIQSTGKEVNAELDRLRKLGYSDEDLTLAKNALENRGWLKKTSKLTPEAENRFKIAMQNSEEQVSNILEQSFPGIKATGPSGMRAASEELFGALDDLAKDVVIENPRSFTSNADKAIERLKGTLANTPQEKEVIGILEAAKQAAVEGRSADVYTRFYRGLNQIGKWGNPKEREHVFTLVKDAIKQTFRDQGPEGKRLASALEDANKSWIKYLNAEDVSEMLAKVTTEEGVNFSKLARSLDNPNNYKTLEKALGKESASNMKKIADTASSIKGLEKTMLGGQVKQALGSSKLAAVAYAIATGNIAPIKAYIGAMAASKISTRFLTDPKYQNLRLKMLNAVNDQNWNLVKVISESMMKELDSNSHKSHPSKETTSQPQK